MAKQTLRTDYKDDIMASSMSGKRRYRQINNPDGTISLEDVTEYTQVGSNFGAGDINASNKATNEAADKGTIIDELDDINVNTKEKMIAGALAVKQLSSNMGGLSFYEDETGKYVVGADNIPTPLSKRARLILRVSSKSTDTNNTQSGTVVFDNTDLKYKYVTKDGVKTAIEAKELTFTYSRHIPTNDNSAVASISLIFSDD